MKLIKVTANRHGKLAALLFSTTVVWALIACGTTTGGGGQATDLDATVQAQVQATVAALPTATVPPTAPPIPTRLPALMQTPTPGPTPEPTPTPTLEPTPIPTPTLIPTPRPTLTPTPTPVPELLPTPTPAPTPKPTLVPILLPPGTSKLLYREDFEDPTSGWGSRVRDHYERGYVQGEYRFLTKNTNSISGAVGLSTFTDFDLRVQARYEGSQRDKAYGVAFRYVDSDNYYVFWVNPVAGTFRFREQVRDRWMTLIGWSNSPVIKPSAQPMELRVVAKGTRFKFYVNDELVASHTDGSFPSGRVGIMSLNVVDTDGAEMFFDNLRVFGLR